MPNGLGWVPISAEMDPSKTEVGGNNGFLAGRNPEYGAIVADSGDDIFAPASLSADARNQRFFVQRHDGIHYIRTAKSV